MHSGLVEPADKTEAVSLCEFFLDNCRLDEMEEDSEEDSENFINKYAKLCYGLFQKCAKICQNMRQFFCNKLIKDSNLAIELL